MGKAECRSGVSSYSAWGICELKSKHGARGKFKVREVLAGGKGVWCFRLEMAGYLLEISPLCDWHSCLESTSLVKV
jgi:hypothetical protein